MRKASSNCAMRARDLGIGGVVGVLRVERGEVVELGAADLARDAVGVGEVEHGLAAGAQLHALVLGREEARGPEVLVERLVAGARDVLRDHHDEAGQVAVGGAETVERPGSEARAAGVLVAGLEEGHRRRVVDQVGVQRLHDAQLVGDARGVRQELREPGAGLAVAREGELGGAELLRLARGHRGHALAHAHGVGDQLAAARDQTGLEVEEVDLRGRAGLREQDHAFRARREVQHRGGARVGEARLAQQQGQRGAADSRRGATEELSTGGGEVHRHSRESVSSRFRITVITPASAAISARSDSGGSARSPAQATAEASSRWAGAE